jgi:hypothetical protein
VIAFNNCAEFEFFQTVGWPQPASSLDMYLEYRHLHNDGSIETRPKGFYGELGALDYFGEDAMDAAAKEGMQDRFLQRPPFDDIRITSLDYCEGDVDGLIKLTRHLTPTIRNLNQR